MNCIINYFFTIFNVICFCRKIQFDYIRPCCPWPDDLARSGLRDQAVPGPPPRHATQRGHNPF